MLFDNMIRDYARQDLKRLIPATHYWLRDHKPEADRELVDPILREPAMFQLTARERVAATALSDLATYEIRTRAIDNATMGHDDTSAPVEMTFDQVRERWGRREVFRRSALVYARMLNDQQLIEAYQQPLPQPDEPGAIAKQQKANGTEKVWTEERKREVRAYRERYGLKKTAEHYNVSQATISEHVPASEKKKAPSTGRAKAPNTGPWGGLLKK